MVSTQLGKVMRMTRRLNVANELNETSHANLASDMNTLKLFLD